MKKKAIIISIKGQKLTKLEKQLIKKENPWGIILFRRNIKSFNQIKKHKVNDFWESLESRENSLTIIPGEFYILKSKQKQNQETWCCFSRGCRSSRVPVVSVLRHRHQRNEILRKRSDRRCIEAPNVLGKNCV